MFRVRRSPSQQDREAFTDEVSGTEPVAHRLPVGGWVTQRDRHRFAESGGCPSACRHRFAQNLRRRRPDGEASPVRAGCTRRIRRSFTRSRWVYEAISATFRRALAAERQRSFASSGDRAERRPVKLRRRRLGHRRFEREASLAGRIRRARGCEAVPIGLGDPADPPKRCPVRWVPQPAAGKLARRGSTAEHALANVSRTTLTHRALSAKHRRTAPRRSAYGVSGTRASTR